MDKATLDDKLKALSRGVLASKTSRTDAAGRVAVGLIALENGEDFVCMHGGQALFSFGQFENGDILKNEQALTIPKGRFAQILESRTFIPKSQYSSGKRYQTRLDIWENRLATPRSQVGQARAAVQTALAALAAAEAEVVTRKNELTTARSICARHEHELETLLDSDAVKEAFTDL